jgi:predicted short-subunit dehydrogenase-like oxidoreductase (DUF2520 family)
MTALDVRSAMLPGMKGKPVIAIVGAGNFAGALAVSLRAAGYKIESVIGRTSASSRARARKLAREVGARDSTQLPKDSRAAVVWFCVPDDEIQNASRAAAEQIDCRNRVALHSSGALTSDELDALRRSRAAVASVHPLMTFVRRSRPPFMEVPFAIEGDPHAVRVARQLVKDLGGRAYTVRKQEKAAYHAWATFVSPLFTALLATAERVAGTAGIPQKQSRQRAIPILRQTLENYAGVGAAAGFSGPIVRGDVETVKRHLRVLRDMPHVCQVYRALALAAVDTLPGKKKKALRIALRS